MKRVFMLRFCIVLVAVILVFTVVALLVHKFTVAPVGPAGQFSISNERMTLKIFTAAPADVADLRTNQFTKYVENALNVKLNFINVKPEAAHERITAMLLSKDYPPILLSSNLSLDEQFMYGKSGVLRPLDQLIEKYGTNIKRIFADNPALQREITASDGHIYALPSINECFHCDYAQKLWVNTTWLNTLHLSIPHTTEEYYHMLKAFKTQDPNGNGLADEIPLVGAVGTWYGEITGFIMNAFIYNDENYFYVQAGKVGLAAAQPEWREGLAYLRRLYEEELIDPASFTQSIDGLIQTAIDPQGNRVGSVTLGHIRLAFNDLNQDRHREYDTIPPLIGPHGFSAAGYIKTMPVGKFAITDQASDAEAVAAIRLADFLYSEAASVRNEFGPEGIYWRAGQAGELDEHGQPAKYTLKAEFWNQYVQNEGWSQMGISYRNRELRESWAVPDDMYSKEGYEHRLYVETERNYQGKEPEEVIPANIYVAPEDAYAAERLQTQINDYIESNRIQFITGVKRLDHDWDDYVQGLKELGLDKYLNIYQRAYDHYKEGS